jgi:protein-disulfide isomerase
MALSASAAEPLIEGNPKSLVRVIIYEDLQCPDCHNFRKMLDEVLLARYQDRVAFEHRDFPLAKHSWARQAAIAARYFEKQNPKLAIEFRRVTMAELKQITPDTLAARVGAFAKKWALDPVKAVEALNDPALAAAVEADFQDGVARGVSKTPTVFVDGEPFIERFTAAEVAKSLDAALALYEKSPKP